MSTRTLLHLAFPSLVLAALVGCQSSPAAQQAAPAAEVAKAPAAPAAPAAAGGPKTADTGSTTYGQALAAATPVAFAELLANPDAYQGKTIATEAQVRTACTRKGCWMELAEAGTEKGQGCRVTFKDYGFFVPTDSAGAAAKVQGILEVKTVSKADVDHLESEGGQFSKKFPDGSAREIRLVATGVELTKG